MTTVRTQEATSSTSQCAYHVFLSFQGEDTCKNFIDHLYTAFIGAGFGTFRGDDENGRGENIKPELQKAIQLSRISIIILSKDYASSGWCLDELVLILECKKTSKHVVLPLFYDMDPSQVRKQTGGFAEAFAWHEEKFKAATHAMKTQCMSKLNGWKAALREVADLAGMVLQTQSDGHESKFIKKVVKVVGDKLNRTALSVAPHLIGIDDRIRNINTWLQDGSTEVSIMILHGMGGIGKTTTAKILYNLNFGRFEGSSFLANVRKFSEQPDGLIRLQRQLLSNILKGREPKIHNIDEGIIKIKDALCCKKVLLVLDDVDQRDQLDAILGMQDWFYPGSKIILTTRHERLLKGHEVYKVHEVEKLEMHESLELFSWHAFGQNHPIEGYIKHSIRVVNYCKGLPLALQVLGSSLSGRNIHLWESALDKLEAIPDSDIIKKLQISYDTLQDDHDQNLFLDIVCFFVGEDKDCVITILDACNFYTIVGLHNLIDRCLLTIDNDNKLMMHQLLQKMGREIIQHESPRKPGKRSRLWRHKDGVKVLRENMGTETLEGFSLILHVSKEEMPSKTSFFSNNKKRLHSEDFHDRPSLGYQGNSSKRRCLGILSWLSTYPSPTKSVSSSSNEVDFQTDAFSTMPRLRLLQLHNVRLNGDYQDFPQNIRWLCWQGFSLKSIPDRFPLESLVYLDMQNSSLEVVWKRTKLLRLLKILDLSHSKFLKQTPDFSEIPNLERLSLEYCVNLTEVDESLGELGSLLVLNLKGCKNLWKLPRNIGHLKSLQKLILSGCSKLSKFPTELGKMQYLTVLHADGTSIYQSPSSTREMKSLGSPLWSWMSKPKKSPESCSSSMVSLSRSLVNLSLAYCNLSDDAIPNELGTLSLLKDLNLNGNHICSLPKGIKSLIALQSLWLCYCMRLQSLPELPSSLITLQVVRCPSLESVGNIPNRPRSIHFGADGCNKLVEAHRLFKVERIQNMPAERVNKLGLFNLKLKGNTEVEMFSFLTMTKRKGPLQGLFEFGIFSTFVHGSELPDWFGYRSTGSFICFNVPSLPVIKIIGLNMCIIYAYPADERSNNSVDRQNGDFYISVNNKTKDRRWIYSPLMAGIPDDGEDMTWLSYWKLGNQLESGDEVDISVSMWFAMQLKEFIIQPVYEQEEQVTPHNIDTSFDNVIDGGDLSAFQVLTGTYLLTNHDFEALIWVSLGI